MRIDPDALFVSLPPQVHIDATNSVTQVSILIPPLRPDVHVIGLHDVKRSLRIEARRAVDGIEDTDVF